MYPASNNCNHNPISFSGQVTPNRSLFNTDINPSSKFEDPHSTSSFHFPSPFIQYEDAVNEVTWQQLDDLFMITRQQPMVAENSVAEIISNMEDPKRDAVDGLEQEWHRKSGRLTEQITRKRSSKDRHSKINTAHGPRDRRMRLSLDVARKFFDLQDILGFDKASKTVEWLLIKSSSAIKEIMRGLPRMRHSQSIVGANISVSSTSECTEVVSGIDDSTTNDNQQPSISIKVKMKSCCKKEKRAKLARPTALLPLTRESRKVARERARKRTIEKNRLSESKLSMEAKNSTDLHRLESWGHFGTVEESGLQGCKLNPSYEGLTEVEEPKSQERRLLESIREIVPNDILVVTGNWNPSSIYNYQENAEVSHEHHQFSDFQLCGKTWEAYKNMSLGG